MSTSERTRIECRAFVAESEVPCCNGSNYKSLCQPDTGIARVIVDVLSASHPNASTWCKAGVDLDAISQLALNDTCPPSGQPEYCPEKPKPVHSVLSPVDFAPSTLLPASDSSGWTPYNSRKCFRLIVVSSMLSIIQVKLMLTILIKWFVNALI